MYNFPHVSLFMQNVTNLYLFSKVQKMNALPENLTETKIIRNGLLQTWNGGMIWHVWKESLIYMWNL